MNQRLSRKEIKRDEFMESLGEAFEWVRGHLRNLIGLGLALLVALVLVVAYMGYSESREHKADEALAAALRIYQSPLDPVAANPTDPGAPTFADADARALAAKERFESVQEDFGSADAAQIANVYLGQIAALDGDMESARSHWQKFVAKSSNNALAVEVRVNLMELDRAAGRGDDLVTELRAMLSGPNTGLPPDLLWYQLGLTLEELDRQTEANEAFHRLLEDYPQSAFAPAARERTGGGQSPLFGT